MKTVLSIVGEHQPTLYNIILSQKANSVYLIYTSKAHKERWARHLILHLKSKGCALIGSHIVSDTVSSSLDLMILEVVAVTEKELKTNTEIILNLGNGTRLHTIALWQVLLDKSVNSQKAFKGCYADVYSNNIYEWHFKDGKLVENKYPYANEFGLEDLARIYGYRISNNEVSHVTNFGETLKKLKAINPKLIPKKKGDVLERETFIAVCEQLLNFHELLIKEVYFNPIITRFNSKTAVAEYDVLFLTSDNRVIIVECKDGDTTMKAIEAQQKLASSWGAGFARMVYVRNFKDIKSFFSVSENCGLKNISLVVGDKTSEDIPAIRLNKLLETVLKN